LSRTPAAPRVANGWFPVASGSGECQSTPVGHSRVVLSLAPLCGCGCLGFG
jgi:hypothetical protein